MRPEVERSSHIEHPNVGEKCLIHTRTPALYALVVNEQVSPRDKIIRVRFPLCDECLKERDKTLSIISAEAEARRNASTPATFTT